MTSVLASWRTSLAGAAVLLAVAACLYTGALDGMRAAPLVAIAVGLLAARDGSVTSEQSGAKGGGVVEPTWYPPTPPAAPPAPPDAGQVSP